MNNYESILYLFNDTEEKSIKFRNNINKDDNWLAIAKNYLSYNIENINKVNNFLDIVDAIYKCASYDIDLDGQEAYLMFNYEKDKGNENNKINRCKLGLMTNGIIKRLYKSGIVKFIHIDIVYDTEEFEYFISQDGYNFKHKPDYKLRNTLNTSREEIIDGKKVNVPILYDHMILGYVRYVLNDGTVKIHLCDKKYIMQCKNTSRMKFIWNSWAEQMIKKTVIRSSVKELPQLGEMLDEEEDNNNYIQPTTNNKSNADELNALMDL